MLGSKPFPQEPVLAWGRDNVLSSLRHSTAGASCGLHHSLNTSCLHTPIHKLGTSQPFCVLHYTTFIYNINPEMKYTPWQSLSESTLL